MQSRSPSPQLSDHSSLPDLISIRSISPLSLSESISPSPSFDAASDSAAPVSSSPTTLASVDPATIALPASSPLEPPTLQVDNACSDAQPLDGSATLQEAAPARDGPPTPFQMPLPSTIDEMASAAVSDEDIFCTHGLAPYNLAINSVQNFLLCTWCRVVVNPAYISTHFKDYHSARIPPVELQQLRIHLEEIRDEICIPVEMPSLPPPDTSPHAPWAGLPIHNGFRCTDCHFVSTSAGSVSSHHYRMHSEPHPRVKQFQRCKLQSIHQRAWFEVLPPPPQDNASTREPSQYQDIIQSILDDLKRGITSHDAEDAREISMWLKTTQWHTHTAPYDTEVLRTLVEFPSDNPKLISGIRAYFLAWREMSRAKPVQASSFCRSVANAASTVFGRGR